MPAITVKMKNGALREFPETSRAGGSWCTHIRYMDAFAIIEDAYGNQTAIPAQDVAEINIARSKSW